MEPQNQGTPAVYPPTRRNPETLQNLPAGYRQREPPAKAATSYFTQSAPFTSSYSPSDGSGYNPSPGARSVSSQFPEKELRQQNGEGRRLSERRRSSQGKDQRPAMGIPSPDTLPAAPDAPRAPPPVSYRGPYDTGPPAPRQGGSRSFSARARILQEEVQSPTILGSPEEDAGPPEQLDAQPHRRSVSDSSALRYPQVRSAVPASYSSSSGNPTIPLQDSRVFPSRQDSILPSPLSRSNTCKASDATTTTNKSWASDRSPLQKLEVKLNDISKEEKRARVQEAEQRLRESKAGRESRRPSGEPTQATENAPSRRVSVALSKGFEEPKLEGSPGSVVRRPQRGTDSEGERQTVMDRTIVQAQSGSSYGRQEKSQRLKTYDESGTDRSSTSKGRGNSPHKQPLHIPERLSSSSPKRDSERSVQFQDQHHRVGPSQRGARSADEAGQPSATVANSTAPTAIGTTSGRGLEGIIERSGSRKPDKEDPVARESRYGHQAANEVPPEQQPLYAERMEFSKVRISRDGVPDPLPPKTSQISAGHALRYEIPPQTAGGQQARQKVGFDDSGKESVKDHPSEKHHTSKIEPARLAPRRMTEWRRGKTARLAASDLVMDTYGSGTKHAWWEKGKSRGQNHGGGTRALSGGFRDRNGQTSFQPPLYLKCGPLLRYTGLKRELISATNNRGGTQGLEREIWRGSVMIVTVDSDSKYGIEPRLRLFSQPMGLLPMPRQQSESDSGQHLAPVFVDPIAGLPKVSRTGRTIYVKPVEHLAGQVDFSRIEDNRGLFEDFADQATTNGLAQNGGLANTKTSYPTKSRVKGPDGEERGRFQEVKGIRLHAEGGATFWRFNLEVELGPTQACIAYRINRGPAMNFWVPAKGQTMNVMFHTCNGFSLSVTPHNLSGPDPMWRDVLGAHQTRPFHVMIGGGDQIYNDAVTRQTTLFRDWLGIKNPHQKHSAPFSQEMQDELEAFYLERYSMWFSQGLFGMANAQIPMVNIWDDHDIIDGFGSYPHHFMGSPVFTGLGAVAFKYYMLFQHQSVPDETQAEEPSWLLGAAPGPYISELSRSVFLSLGKKVAFLGLDCRTERMRDEVFSEQSYLLVLDRCRKEIVHGETKHLIVLLGVPIAYPRMVWLENVLTSRLMDPIKAIGRSGMLGGLLNQFDGGVEVLDDLDDHWTAKNHKAERTWFIEELQELAAETSVRITILGGDVHLAAVGQFYSNPKLKIPKDEDHRYMPNVISSAIVNTPPPELLADVLNKRDRVHHFDKETDEVMIPMFTHDVDGKVRSNKRLLPRRNWCSIREYHPGTTPPPTPPTPENRAPEPQQLPPGKLQRTLSLSRKDVLPGNLIRRLSQRRASYNPSKNDYPTPRHDTTSYPASGSGDGYFPPSQSPTDQQFHAGMNGDGAAPPLRPGVFRRRPTNLSEKAARKGETAEVYQSDHINLEGGLDIVLNCEVSQKDPAGSTVPYRLLVPALFYEGQGDLNTLKFKTGTWMSRLSRRSRKNTAVSMKQTDGAWDDDSSENESEVGRQQSEGRGIPQAGAYGLGARYGSKDRDIAQGSPYGQGGKHESQDRGIAQGSPYGQSGGQKSDDRDIAQGIPYGQGGGYSGVEAYKEKGRRRWF